MGKFKFALVNFLLAAAISILAFYLPYSGRIALVIVGVSFVIGGIRELDSAVEGAACIIFILGAGMIGVGIFLKNVDTILKYVGAAAIALIVGWHFIMKLLGEDSGFGPNTIVIWLAKLFMTGYSACIVAGIYYAVFTGNAQLSKTLIWVGCGGWVAYTVYCMFFMDSDGEPSDGFSFSRRDRRVRNYSRGSGGGAVTLTVSDVERKVRDIAFLCSNEQDSLPCGAWVVYHVTSRVLGNDIYFTVTGNLRGADRLDASSANSVLSNLRWKVESRQRKILEYAEKTLGKFALPQNYNINVEIGEIS
ncbi:MAG: hypothetical protein NC033_05890 [Clostridiales bacterium]|nr:hypothetical protein [Clostridiales bacterium]